MVERPKIAAVVTIYHKYSHAQHIVDRFLEGYGWESRQTTHFENTSTFDMSGGLSVTRPSF